MEILLVLILGSATERTLALSPISIQNPPLHQLPQCNRFHQNEHPTNSLSRNHSPYNRRPHLLHMSFFKDIFDKAFENDSNLSNDRSLQQYDKPEDDYKDTSILQNKRQKPTPKTDVQKRWLESQAKAASIKSSNDSITSQSNTATLSTTSTTTGSTLPGAPLSIPLLTNTRWNLSLYLTGTPDFDPNNSLFGSRTTISTRKSNLQKNDSSSSAPSLASLGFAIGADVLPPKPSLLLPALQFLPDGRCIISNPTSFTTGENEGQWTLSDDGKMVRFSIYVEGWKRTVTTRGTIQNVYWSEGDDVERSSKATYSVPEGWVYGEAGVGYGRVPGSLELAPMLEQRRGVGSVDDEGSGGRGSPTGILRFEKRMGILGAVSKMLPCGMFSAEMAGEEEEEEELS